MGYLVHDCASVAPTVVVKINATTVLNEEKGDHESNSPTKSSSERKTDTIVVQMRPLRERGKILNKVIPTMTKEDGTKELQEMVKKLEEEDSQMKKQLAEMEEKFDTENKITSQDFNQFYAEGVKNFRLEFGTVCEKGRDEVIEKLPSAKSFEDRQKVVNEYLSCLELTRQKAAQRAQAEQE